MFTKVNFVPVLEGSVCVHICTCSHEPTGLIGYNTKISTDGIELGSSTLHKL